MVRVKKRYIVLELHGTEKGLHESPTGVSIYDAIRKCYHQLYGDFGIAKLGPFGVKYFDNRTNIVFIQCNRDPHRQLLHAIAMVKSINSKPFTLQTLYVSGTIKSCQKFLLLHSKQELLKELQDSKVTLLEKNSKEVV